MTVIIRSQNAQDYLQIAAILAAAKPYAAVTAEILAYRDQTRPAFCQFRRFVAVLDGRPVGFAHYTQFADMFEPNAFWVDICVLPTYQQRGIGSTLYATLQQSLEAEKPFNLRTQIREDMLAAIRFATRRGFQESGRRWESSLDVTTFDETQFPDYKDRVEARGIHIVSYTDLADDPDRDRKLHQLQTELDRDVPMLVPATPMTFAQYTTGVLQNPALVPDGLLVATHGNEYIGMSSFFEEDARTLLIDITGVIATYRRKGVALALKVQGILFARCRGYASIVVVNDLANQGMLAINDKLGFERSPALVQFAQEFQ